MARALTYREIADDLHRRIRIGEYPPGSALPQYPDLAGSYGVSVSTAQRAIMLLRDRGLVTGVPGRGVFVTGRPV
jgi:GntR family transcriptional regulator